MNQRSRERSRNSESSFHRAALAFAAFAVLTSSWNALRVAPGLALCDVFFVISGLLLCLSVTLRHHLDAVLPLWLVGPASVLLALVLLSSVLANTPLAAILPGARLVIALLLAPLLISLAPESQRGLSLLVTCWIISATASCTIGAIDQVAGFDLGRSITGAPAAERVAGLSTQANHLAFTALFAMPFSLIRLLRTADWVPSLAYALSLTILLAGVLVSGSRGGVLGVGLLCLLSVPILRLAQRGQLRTLLVGAGALLALVAVAGTSNFVSLERLSQSSTVASGVAHSNRLRGELLSTAVADFEARPIVGHGFAEVRAAHNIYVQLAVAGGVLAPLSLLWFLLGGATASFRCSRDRSIPVRLRDIASASCVVFLLWALMGTMQNQLYDRYLLVPAGLFLAIPVLLRRATRVHRSSRAVSSATFRPTASVLAPDQSCRQPT